MELLRGRTLARELEGMRGLPLRRVTTIALQLCDALDSAHAQGIVHRDLKPGNIIILDDPPGRDLIKVLDFGLAKSLVTDASSQVTNTNAILGTPLYMAPEQIEGRPTDQRADLYALGCILYQMVTGRPPFVNESVNLVLAAHLGDEPAPLPSGVPVLLAQTIAHLMTKDAARRMASARAAREAIQAVVEGGFPSGDVADTTPEVDRHDLPALPIALAVTDPAGARAADVPTSAVGSSRDAVRPTGARWLAPLLVGLLAGGGVAAYVVMRATTAPTAASPPDAARAPQVAPPDAAVAAEVPAPPPDAQSEPQLTTLIDAAAATAPADAARATPPRDAGRRQPPRPPRATDAAVEPTIDWVPVKP